jgi:hypothetical protein
MLKLVPDKNSPDVTLHLFQAIEAHPEVKPRYQGLLRVDPRLNARIAAAIKELLFRENDEVVKVSPEECRLIKTYTRFKP